MTGPIVGELVHVKAKWAAPTVCLGRDVRLWEPDVAGREGLAILVACVSLTGTLLEYVVFHDLITWVPTVSLHGAYHDPTTGRTEWAVSEPSCRAV